MPNIAPTTKRDVCQPGRLDHLISLTAKLHSSETEVDRWTRVLDKLFVGAWETFPNGKVSWISDQGLMVMGGPLATLTDFKDDLWLNRIHSDDSSRVIPHWTECLENRSEFMSVHRMVWLDGHTENLFFYGRCNSRGWVGTIIPVTPVLKLACLDKHSTRL